MSRLSSELVRHSVDESMSLDRKVIRHKPRTISESICQNELVKNMIIEICYEVMNINANSIYILIKVCLDRYNKYELCAYINSGCSVCFGERSLFLKFM